MSRFDDFDVLDDFDNYVVSVFTDPFLRGLLDSEYFISMRGNSPHPDLVNFVNIIPRFIILGDDRECSITVVLCKDSDAILLSTYVDGVKKVFVYDVRKNPDIKCFAEWLAKRLNKVKQLIEV